MWFSRHRNPRIADELRFHRDRLIADYLAAGMDRREAERRAFLEFGNVSQIEESVRDVRGRWLDDFAKDLHHARQTLRRNPGFSAVAVLSLALGIGANTAMFNLVNGVLLRTLPVTRPDRLVQVTRLLNGRPGQVSYPLFELFRDHITSISAAFAQSPADQAIAIDGDDEFVTADLVSGGYFVVLGLEPAAGRLLGPSDDVESPTSLAAVISDGYWQRRFGRSDSAIGKSFTLRDRAFTIVGVMPRSFESAQAGRAPDLMLPLVTMMSDMQRRSTDFNSLRVLARLKPGATVEQATAEAQVLFKPFVEAQAAGASDKDRPVILRQRVAAVSSPDGFNQFRDNLGEPLLVLTGIVGVILLLVCVNLSGLLLARAAARQREISIRLAIGASRGRIVRQFLTESLVLASLGGVAGLLFARWFSATLVAFFLTGRELAVAVGPDWRVFAFTIAVSVVACFAAGLLPALQAVRITVNPSLKEVRAHGPGRLGRALVVAQLAMSMVLVVGATMFVGTLVKLYGVDRGFESDGLLVVQVRSVRPFAPARAPVVQGALVERLATLPGVRSASAAQILPVGGSLWDRTVQVEGYAFRADESEWVGFNAIGPDYFATIDTPILSGREFSDHDAPTAPRVAVVNDSFAQYFFGSQSALGRHVTSVGVTYEIVGIVRDAKYQSLRDATLKTMYVPWTQAQVEQPSRYSYLVRVEAGDPMRLAPGLDRIVRDVDPALRVRTTMPYESVIARSIASERILAMFGGLFGLLALIIAALGLFGLLAFQVERRTNELGVRMALGASRPAMIGLVLREVAVLVTAGITFGAAASLMLTGTAEKILFGLTPTDPIVFVVAGSVLAAAAIVASSLPALRASRVDPVVALRHE